jgi:hypothetical protein
LSTEARSAKVDHHWQATRAHFTIKRRKQAILRNRPWSIDVVIEFGDERRALAFERYLKSVSDVAFAHRRLR